MKSYFMIFGVVFGIFSFNLAYITVAWLRDNEIGLSGNFRKEFVEAAVPSCVERQRGDPLNRGASDEIIIQFCGCYAANLVNRLSINEVKSLASGEINTTAMSKVESITIACANDLTTDIEKPI